MAKSEEAENEIPFDEPALALANGDEKSSFEAALNSVSPADKEPAAERDTDNRSITISQDITGDSTCTGVVGDYKKYFESRFSKLKEILEKRSYDYPVTEVKMFEERAKKGQNNATIIGMVEEVNESANGYPMVEFNDETGRSTAILDNSEEMKQFALDILPSEVLAIEGQITDDGSAIFGNDVYRPEVPPGFRKRTADRDVEAVLISDIHFGSQEFASERWELFVDWIRGQEKIEYILIAGDLVEGIGTYPGQKQELVAPSIEQQHEIAAEGLAQLPDDVDIICSVGNHDSVRLAEPQPALPTKFTKYFNDNVTFVGNPAMVDLEGVKFLLYHGMSLNPLIESLTDLDIHEPTTAMLPLLKRRHLSPKYGDGVRVAPEHEDYLAIEDVPDFLHSGHVHTFGTDTYNNVTMVNTGCWQERTDFQKSKNVFPDVGHAVRVKLQSGSFDELSF